MDPDPDTSLFVRIRILFIYFFSGLEYVNHSFAYVAHFAFLRDVWIRTQSFGNVDPIMGKKANSGPKLVIQVPYLYRTGLQIIVFKMTDWD